MQAHHAWSAHTTIFWAPTRLEGYCGAIKDLDAAEFGQDQAWIPTQEQRALRIRLDHGSVLIAAKGTPVKVRCPPTPHGAPVSDMGSRALAFVREGRSH